MYYTYVLQSLKDMDFYTGLTKNLELSVERHNRGFVVSTKYSKPVNLIYYEVSLNKKDAIKRGKYLKSFRGKIFLKRRLKSYLTG